jgi:hypothetical protein
LSPDRSLGVDGFLHNYFVSKLSLNPLAAVAIGFILTVPFFILEWLTTSGFLQSFPFHLFIFMWLSSSISVFLLWSVFKDFREKRSPLIMIIKVILLASLVLGFVELIIDQWPCFMGIPNCD